MEALARNATVVQASHTGELTSKTWCVGITFDDAFRSVLDNAIPELLSRSLQSTIFVPVEFIGRTPAWASEGPGLDREQVMTAEELRSLPDLVDLGSHTLKHPHLTTLDEAELREELVTSRVKLETVRDRPVRLLAFPYGDYDERVVRACREAGYERVFMIDPQPADPGGGDLRPRARGGRADRQSAHVLPEGPRRVRLDDLRIGPEGRRHWLEAPVTGIEVREESEADRYGHRDTTGIPGRPR